MDFKLNFKQALHSQLPVQDEDFTTRALALFNFQVRYNKVYKAYINHLGINPTQVTSLTSIPFLPIEFFKTQQVQSGNFHPEVVFLSSGTTLTTRSQHLLPEVSFYLQNTQQIFEKFYGPLTDFTFLALLPSYLEQGNSSLVAMVDYFRQVSGQSQPAFFLHDLKALVAALKQARSGGKKVMLFGVTYALLDLADFIRDTGQAGLFRNAIIMETGGMKGRRREMIRSELHSILQEAFEVTTIHSEYGMTELLSQAYSQGEGLFKCAPTLRVLLRDINDPFHITPHLRSGGINIIDLANVDSCAFIETKDIGKIYPDGMFEVLGRFDNADIRGCNLLVQ